VKSFLQFLLFVLVITLALAGLYAWKSGQFAPSPAAPATQHALPDVKPALSAGSLPGLAALDAEFGRLAEAVVPSVVTSSLYPVVGSLAVNTFSLLERSTCRVITDSPFSPVVVTLLK